MATQITYIKVKNFRAFRNMEIRDIPRFAIFVGANGTGKSTLFSVFSFLREALTTNVTTALGKLGGRRGFKEVRSRNAEGPIEIQLKFRESLSKPLITYTLHIDEAESGPVVAREVLEYRRGSSGKPWQFLSFSNGKGKAVTNEVETIRDERELSREDQTLKTPDILAIKALAQFKQFPAAVAFGSLIENWHVSDFHISQARKEQTSGYEEHLSTEGENLSNVLDYLHHQHPRTFQEIVERLKARVPGISKVETLTTEDHRLLLKIQDGSFPDPFLIPFVSDGTIKMLAYLVLLYDPKPHPLLCVEEPENQLYPGLLEELAEEFRAYSERGGQVFVSTHSYDFLNAAELDEVFWLEKKDGYTAIQRAKKDEQIAVYVENGDKLGRLWRQGFFGEVTP